MNRYSQMQNKLVNLHTMIQGFDFQIRDLNISQEQKEIAKQTIRKIEDKLSQAKYVFSISSQVSIHHILLDGLANPGQEITDLLSPDELSAALLLDINKMGITDPITQKYNLKETYTNNKIQDAKKLTLEFFNHIKEINKGKEKYLPEFLILASTLTKDINEKYTEENKNHIFFNSPIIPELFNVLQEENLSGASVPEDMGYLIKTAKTLNTDTKEIWENPYSPYYNTRPYTAVHFFGANIKDNNFSFNKERKKYVLDNLKAPVPLKEIKDKLIRQGINYPDLQPDEKQIKEYTARIKKETLRSTLTTSQHLDEIINVIKDGQVKKIAVRDLIRTSTPKATEEAIAMDKLIKELKPEDIKDQTFFKMYYNYTKPYFNAKNFISLQNLYLENKNQIPIRDINIIYPDTKNDKVYTAKLLPKNNPTYLFAGNITDCCQKINGEAESVVWDTAQNMDSWIFAIFDDSNKIIVQSYIWKSEDTYTIDSIESQIKTVAEDNIILQDFFKIHLANIYKQFAAELGDLVFIGNNNTPATNIKTLSPKVYEREFKNQTGIYKGDSSKKKLFHIDYSNIDLNDKPDNTKDKELYLYKLFAAFRNSNYQQGKYIYELGKTKTDFTSMDRITLEIDLFQKALKEEFNTEQLKQTDLYQNFTPNADQKIYDEIMRLIINDIETNYLYELINLYIRTDAKQRLLKILRECFEWGQENQISTNIKTKYQDIIQDPKITIYQYLKDNNIKYVATSGNIHILDTRPITLSQRILDIAYFNKINITQRSGDIENPIEHKKILPNKIEIE
jgi:hypothetical protein